MEFNYAIKFPNGKYYTGRAGEGFQGEKHEAFTYTEKGAYGKIDRVKWMQEKGARVTRIDAEGRGIRVNPTTRKTAARTQRAAESYVRRPSQITKKAPSKRLKKRRTVNLQSPRGVFPNPKKRDPTYWVIVLHDGYLSYRSDSGYTGSQPFDTMEGNTPRQKALSFIKQLGIKRGQYEILKQNPDSVHFDIDVNSHNARGAKAKTRVNPSARKKQIVVEYELSGQNFAKRNRGMYGWKELATFPDTPEGSENAIQYAEAYHKIAPHLRIQVVTK